MGMINSKKNNGHEKLAGNAHYFRKIISPFVDQVKGKRKQNVISVEWRVPDLTFALNFSFLRLLY